MQIKENFWPPLTLHCAVNTEALQHVGGTTALWKSEVKLSSSPGLPPASFPPPGKALCISVGRGRDGTCAQAASARAPRKQRGAFFTALSWHLGGMCILTALIAHSYLFTSKSPLQRKNLLFVFPLLTHLKKSDCIQEAYFWGIAN